MAAAGVPTAEARLCVTEDEVAAALDAFGAPYVVKDDGLAAGKGVVVTDDRAEALAHAKACGRVVIEEFLDGPEVSLFAVTDGVDAPCRSQPAQDFKRVGDGDAGPNTGGMGAYSPLPWAPAGLVDEIMERVVQPTIDEMRRRGTPFSGLLYAGLALTSRGLKVIEFNARFGDPETQVVLARLRTPLGDAARRCGRRHARRARAAASGPTTRRSPSWSRARTTRRRRAPATRSAGSTRPTPSTASTCCTRAPRSAPTARSSRRAGACSASRPPAPTSPRRARAAYAAVDLITLDGSHHRTDIAAKAASGA